MYGRINIINILFILIIFSMNPFIIAYYFKYNYYLNALFFSLINLIFIHYLIKHKLILHLPKIFQVLLISHIFIAINTLIMYQKISHELLFFTFFIDMIIMSFLLVKDVDNLIKNIAYIVKALLILNLIVFFSVNILKLPYSQIVLNINGEYIRHHFMFLGFVLDHQENLLGWSFHRVHSYFTEPAQFSTFLIFLLIVLKINGYNKSFTLIWINGLLSFSMMFYIFILAYIFFKVFKNIKAYYLILVLFILQLLIASWLINDIGMADLSSVVNKSFDSSNSFLMKAGSIMSRLEFFYNNISSILIYPFGIGYADIIDQKLLLFNNIEDKNFVGIRSATGFLGTVVSIGGLVLFVLYFLLLFRIENKFKNNLNNIYHIRAGMVLFSLLSTSGLFSPFVAVLIGITFKNLVNKNHLLDTNNQING